MSFWWLSGKVIDSLGLFLSLSPLLLFFSFPWVSYFFLSFVSFFLSFSSCKTHRSVSVSSSFIKIHRQDLTHTLFPSFHLPTLIINRNTLASAYTHIHTRALSGHSCPRNIFCTPLNGPAASVYECLCVCVYAGERERKRGRSLYELTSPFPFFLSNHQTRNRQTSISIFSPSPHVRCKNRLKRCSHPPAHTHTHCLCNGKVSMCLRMLASLRVIWKPN